MSITDAIRQRVVNVAHMFRVKHSRETDGHREQERETATSLGLMATAAAAGPDMTDEQAIFLSSSSKGMRDRIEVLLGNPRRSLAQERELTMIQRELARLEGRPVDAPSTPRRLGLISPVTASPALAVLLSPWTWLVAVGAFALLQMGLKERIESQRDEARAEAARLESSRDAYARALGEERSARARDVAQVLEDTATTVEQMRRAEARRIARQRREEARHEDLANGRVDFTERLRELARPDAGLPADPAAAPGGDPAGAVSAEPGGDADNGANP